MEADPEVLLNESFSLLLMSMDEPQANALRLVVLAAGLSDPEIDPHFPKRQARRLEVQADSRYFEITFDRYVYYLVVNESHWAPDTEAEGSGAKLTRYKKSQLLSLADTISFPYDHHDRPLKHLEIATESHLIHVLTYGEPEIKIHSSMPTVRNIENADIWYHR